MHISEVVDLDAYPYVCPFNYHIATFAGDVHIPRGFLADGASGVLDLCQEAFFAHDRLYLTPRIGDRTVSKLVCDLIYGQLLWRYRRPLVALVRPVGLTVLGWPAWRRYRRLDVTEPDHWQRHVVSHAAAWEFPSFRTRDAVWVGAGC